jgi:hypothetical protein
MSEAGLNGRGGAAAVVPRHPGVDVRDGGEWLTLSQLDVQRLYREHARLLARARRAPGWGVQAALLGLALLPPWLLLTAGWASAYTCGLALGWLLFGGLVPLWGGRR